MAAQPLVGAVEFQAAELDPPRALGQHEMAAPAIDQPRRAGHAGNPRAVGQVDVGDHEAARRQPEDAPRRRRLVDGALEQPALVVRRIGQQAGKIGVMPAAQVDPAEQLAGRGLPLIAAGA
jgi:hypothetical protein